MLWYFFSIILFTGSSSLKVMKQNPRLLFVLFSIGNSIDSTWQQIHQIPTISLKSKHRHDIKCNNAVGRLWTIQTKQSEQKSAGIWRSSLHTSPKAWKYSLIFSSGVSGEMPPTKIFFTGSLDFMAFAFLGSITFPLSLCSFCWITCNQ